MSDLFDRARQAMKLEDLAAKLVKLRGRGDELRGSCPLCGASPSSGSVFAISRAKQTWRCYACERFGDVVDLHAATTGKGVADAARDLAGPAPATGVAKAAEPSSSIDDGGKAARVLRMAADMLGGSRQIVGSLGATYLARRGISPVLIERLDAPRFLADAPHSWNPEAKVWRRAPAIICRIVTPGGATGGVHATYLDPELDPATKGKSKLSPDKLMWGPQGEDTAAGRRRGGSWLIGSFPEGGDLIVGEGIETALSLATRLWRDGIVKLDEFGVCAALSLGALQGQPRRDDAGAVDLTHIAADPAVPAFTWPPCNTAGAALKPMVHIAVDRDMSPIRLKARTGRGRLVDVELDAEARARLSGSLASVAWRDAGWRTQAHMPSPNRDWNDMVRDVGRVANGG